MDKAFVGSARVGYTRCTVYRPDWDNVTLPKLKAVNVSELWDTILESLKEAI